MRQCEVCGIDIEDRRADATTCSPKCRKEAFLKRSIEPSKRSDGTDNLIVEERIIEPDIIFKFTIKQRPRSIKNDKNWNGQKAKVRETKYWYDVPLAAVPVYEKGWPEMPDYMNGRQYFLWWKNEFKMSKKFPDTPEIHNPSTLKGELTYIKAGDNSRHWGTN